MVEVIVDLGSFVLRLMLLVAFAAVARRQIQRARLPNLAVLWTGSSVLLGVFDHYRICSQGLTCDVGGPGAAWYYLRTVGGSWAALNAATFLAIILFLAYRRRALSPELFMRRREVAYASLAGITAMFGVVFIVEAM
jgi:hypothetical protein